jgi:hypothetical protein
MKGQRDHLPITTNPRTAPLDERPVTQVHAIKVPDREGNAAGVRGLGLACLRKGHERF